MIADRLLAHYERVADAPDAIARLRRFILDLAVRGKLVPQDSSDEPASELLKRIAAEKARLVPSLPKPARYERRSPELIPGDCGLSINHPGTQLPHGWLWIPLVQIARLESGHTPSRSRPDWWGGEVPWIGLVDARLASLTTADDTRLRLLEALLAEALSPALTIDREAAE
jgi:type I restriction enzyme, S subunit